MLQSILQTFLALFPPEQCMTFSRCSHMDLCARLDCFDLLRELALSCKERNLAYRSNTLCFWKIHTVFSFDEFVNFLFFVWFFDIAECLWWLEWSSPSLSSSLSESDWPSSSSSVALYLCTTRNVLSARNHNMQGLGNHDAHSHIYHWFPNSNHISRMKKWSTHSPTDIIMIFMVIGFVMFLMVNNIARYYKKKSPLMGKNVLTTILLENTTSLYLFALMGTFYTNVAEEGQSLHQYSCKYTTCLHKSALISQI